LVLKAYAKLNLFLQVLKPKRKDNYHNLVTLFERVDLFDSVTLKKRVDNKIRIICSDRFVPPGEDNLCFRAARLLQDTCGVNIGVDVIIKKRIPVGAGLGGGSADAAATLSGLNKLWRLNLSLSRLVSLSGKIGSDVAFFLYDTPFALGTSRGDKITPLDNMKKVRLWHLLIVPKIHVSTPLIYRKFDRFSGLTRPVYNVKILISALKKKPVVLRRGLLFNNLEAVTRKEFPQVDRLKAKLQNLIGFNSVLMSGSGPAVFGICRSQKEAVLFSKKLSAKGRRTRRFLVRTV